MSSFGVSAAYPDSRLPAPSTFLPRNGGRTTAQPVAFPLTTEPLTKEPTMKTIQFRPLHENERSLLRKMILAGDIGAWRKDLSGRPRVAYRYQQHREGVEYTVALVELPNGDLLIGATKRNPTDPPNQIRGQVEALRRAFASEVRFTFVTGSAS